MSQKLLEQINQDIKTATRDTTHHSWLASSLEFVEKKTGQPRERFVYGSLGLLAVYLIFGHFAALICNLVGFGFPAYASLRALKTRTQDDDTQWLTYWTVFAFFSLIDFASDKILGFFPVYWLAKCVVLIWLQAPITGGATMVYGKVLEPLVERYINTFENAKDEVMHSTIERVRKYQ